MKPYTHRITVPFICGLLVLVGLSLNLHRVWELLEGLYPYITSDKSFALWKYYGQLYTGFLGFVVVAYGLPLYRIGERALCLSIGVLIYFDGVQELFDIDETWYGELFPVLGAAAIGLFLYAFLLKWQRSQRPRIGFRIGK